MEIKCKLKEILKERGISQRDLARDLGLTVSTVFRLVNNKFTKIDTILIAKIMFYLNVRDFNDLFYIDGLPDNNNQINNPIFLSADVIKIEKVDDGFNITGDSK